MEQGLAYGTIPHSQLVGNSAFSSEMAAISGFGYILE
jgi:hypothetical protein